MFLNVFFGPPSPGPLEADPGRNSMEFVQVLCNMVNERDFMTPETAELMNRSTGVGDRSGELNMLPGFVFFRRDS